MEMTLGLLLGMLLTLTLLFLHSKFISTSASRIAKEFIKDLEGMEDNDPNQGEYLAGYAYFSTNVTVYNDLLRLVKPAILVVLVVFISTLFIAL